MKIQAPCIITSRLLPGVRIGETEVSIDYDDWRPDDHFCGQYRMHYRVCIDSPTFNYESTDQASGCGRADRLQVALSACLNFLSSCGECVNYEKSTGRTIEKFDLYPSEVAEWCAANANTLRSLASEIEETPNVIEE